MSHTFDDLAKMAGVSRATVSRYLNGSTAIKEKTRLRLESAIEKLDYVMPTKRRGPKPRPQNAPGSKGAIALVTVGGASLVLGDPTTAAVVQAIQEASHDLGYGLMLDQMAGPEHVPFSVKGGQVRAAIIMGAGALNSPQKSLQARDCVESLSRLLPCALLFSPGHSVPSVDHFTGNDVAMGSYAHRELVAVGCRSFGVIHTDSIFHEASVVRGRAFSDRILLRGVRPRFYCHRNAGVSPESNWPPPLFLYENMQQLVEQISADCTESPLGLFLTKDDDLLPVHSALKNAGLFDNAKVVLAVATTSPIYRKQVSPAPICVDISLSEICRNMIHRLVQRLGDPSLPAMTFLVPPVVLNQQKHSEPGKA